MVESKPRIAIFPGSFDPFTRGHIDIARRAMRCFDLLIIAILKNTEKKTIFTVQERIDLIAAEFADCRKQVQVRSFSGLLVDFAAKMKANAIIRGLRAISDYDYEAQIALMNRQLSPEIETFFLMTREEYSYISSSLVKSVAALGGDVSKLVTTSVAQALKDKIGAAAK